MGTTDVRVFLSAGFCVKQPKRYPYLQLYPWDSVICKLSSEAAPRADRLWNWVCQSDNVARTIEIHVVLIQFKLLRYIIVNCVIACDQ